MKQVHQYVMAIGAVAPWRRGAVALIASCGADLTGVLGGGEARHQLPIINGELPDAPEHAAVVSLHERERDSVYLNIFCSGTLITQDVVITAAHCLDTSRRNKAPTAMDPADLAIYVGDAPVQDPAPALYAVAETWIHPGYDKYALVDDIALVRLANPVTNVTPVPYLTPDEGFTAADEGSLVLNFAGFGQDESGGYDVKLQVDGVLDHIQSAGQIYYHQADAGPCFGDSGGPAFVHRGGAAFVGGLTSYGDNTCSVYGVSTRVDAYEAEILAFIGTEPPPAPDCSADGWCNPECDADADPDCSVEPPPPPTDPVCGDGVCDGLAAGEDCSSCPSDCAAITHPKKGVIACCGNGLCEKREDGLSCATDCL